MEKFDLCIIGGGPSGYAAAMRAIDFGKKVVLIEKSKIGGAGLYNGALSSKTMWELSMKIATVREELGESAEGVLNVSWEKVVRTVETAVFERKHQLFCHAKLLQSVAENKHFSYKRGYAGLINANEVLVQTDNDESIVHADYIMLSTGSVPRKLPEIPIDEQIIYTSDGIQNMKDFPKSIVILGAGVIGCEFATIFSNMGKTKVYLIDKTERILPMEDTDLTDIISTNFESRGVVIHHNAKLENMKIVDGEVEYELSYTDGKREVIRVEKALISVGRVPNIKNLGLEKAGIKITERGYVWEHNTQTNIPNIFVVGDLTEHLALVNIGEMQARYAVEKMFEKKPPKELSYNNISTIMFLTPEAAGVGMNEQQAIQKGIPFRIASIDFSCIARAIAMRKTLGFFKILVTDDNEMKILGMRAVGEHASSAIQAVSLLIHMNQGIEVLANLIHPHPSIIEGIQEAARMLFGKSVYKASVFSDKLKCYRYADGKKEQMRVY